MIDCSVRYPDCYIVVPTFCRWLRCIRLPNTIGRLWFVELLYVVCYAVRWRYRCTPHLQHILLRYPYGCWFVVPAWGNLRWILRWRSIRLPDCSILFVDLDYGLIVPDLICLLFTFDYVTDLITFTRCVASRFVERSPFVVVTFPHVTILRTPVPTRFPHTLLRFDWFPLAWLFCWFAILLPRYFVTHYVVVLICCTLHVTFGVVTHLLVVTHNSWCCYWFCWFTIVERFDLLLLLLCSLLLRFVVDCCCCCCCCCCLRCCCCVVVTYICSILLPALRACPCLALPLPCSALARLLARLPRRWPRYSVILTSMVIDTNCAYYHSGVHYFRF